MDISLITSLYRSDAHLETYMRDVCSVVAQLDLTVEIVVVVNDATETERALLDRFTSVDNLFVNTIYTDRETLYASWNRGIRAATSDVIGFWNVDDKRTVGGLREAYLHLQEGDFEIIDFAFNAIVNDNLIAYSATFEPKRIDPKSCVGPFFMFHRSLYDRAGAFNEHFRIAGDYEWSKRDVVRSAKYYQSDVIGGNFVLHGDNLSGGNSPLEWVECNIILLWHGHDKMMRPVQTDLMRDAWETWGHEGATISDETKAWLWGDGAQSRYEAYTRERQSPQWIRRIRLALARRGLLKSVEWDAHHRDST